MTRQSMRGVGYCARMTPAGDWAFEYAFDLAVAHGVRLNIFFFPSSPFRPHHPRGRRGEHARLSVEQMIALEREARFYYDPLLADYVDVGFRLCEGDEDPELRRCLIMERDFDILVLAYEGHRCRFGGRTVEEFAEAMPCPAVLVGPERSGQVFLNSAAELWIDELGLTSRRWYPLSGVVVNATPAEQAEAQ
jgi:hypothetical protein